MFHHWIALVFFALFALAGIVLTIAGIGGTFLVLAGALIYNLITWSMTISSTALLWLLGLAVLGEVLEWIFTLIGFKAGVSKCGIIGTVIGAIIGAMLLSVIPIIGTIIGFFLGAIVGAFIGEYLHTRHAKKAWKAAKAAFLGRVLVSLSKFILAVIQIVIVMREVI